MLPPEYGGSEDRGERRNEFRDHALRAIDRLDLSPEAGDRIVDVVERDQSDAEYVSAVSNPKYASAFGRILTNPQFAHLEMDREEVDAVRTVRRIEQERAIGIGTQGGGYAVPIELDPSIMIQNAGVVSSLRDLARIRTATSSGLRLVASPGATASWDPEFQEVSDDSSIFSQPILYPEKAQAFIPFSIELGDDSRTLTSELGHVLTDAKTRLEADAFLTGTGHASQQPEGPFTGATTVVTSAGTVALAVADIYSLQESLSPRYQPGLPRVERDVEPDLSANAPGRNGGAAADGARSELDPRSLVPRVFADADDLDGERDGEWRCRHWWVLS